MPMLPLVDSHVHLDDHEFADDRSDVLARAAAAGVSAMVIPAVDAASWPRISELCAALPGLHAAYGLHPTFLARHSPDDLESLPAWLDMHTPVAVGEIGLDFHDEQLDRALQRHYFESQLELAAERQLPVIIHARGAVEDVILTLRHYPGVRGVVHSFSGSEQQAERLWQMGFLIGLGGPVTYDRAKRLHRVVRHMPIEHLLLESDAPDQPPCTHRGKRNEPAYLPDVLRQVAMLRGEPVHVVAAATTRNAQQLFGLDRPLT